jgi:hypothetical protein
MLEKLFDWAAFHRQRWMIGRQFRSSLGYRGNFENPRTYQEKVQFRKLYGNHAFYALVADKFRVRDYVGSRVGARHLIPLLGVYERLHPAHFDDLPDRFIIKANHGCKWHQVVDDKRKLDVSGTVRRFNKLLRKRYGWAAGERHYNFIPPRIVIEELLQDDAGGLPWDYSFFCYNGRDGFQYNFALCSPAGKAAIFTGDWEQMSSTVPEAELAPRMRPANFATRVRVARDLSAEFDFVRVDLYTVGGEVYFGELTCTPHQGYGPIADERRQRMRDDMWHLDAGNPLLYVPSALRQARVKRLVPRYGPA